MSSRSPNAGLGGRTQQAASMVAAGQAPLTFQRTLMPRSTMDQALVTGISSTLSYANAALIQDFVEAVALRLTGASTPDEVDRHAWRRTTIAVDLAVMTAGFGAQALLRPRRGERLPRATARTVGYWATATGFSGAVVGVVQQLLRGRDDTEDHTILVAPFAGVALAAVVEFRRRRREAADLGPAATEASSTAAAKSLGIGLGVMAGLSATATGERLAAKGIGHALSVVLPGSERDYRPIGHAVALSALSGSVYQLVRRTDRRIEAGNEQLEGAYEEPPGSALQSGGPGSLVTWDSLSRQGRRHVATALSAGDVTSVMGKPAIEAIRVYVGFESAPTEHDRVSLAIGELERTGAFDRNLLMVIPPTGTGYVNYVAVEAASYLSLGDMAAVSVQYGLRPSPLSLDRVREGRMQFRRLLEAIAIKLAARPARARPRLVLFGESLGAWTSQDAFLDEGTQGLLDLGVDRALWIGTPYMSAWKNQVLDGHRPDVDRSLLGRFNDFGQLEALEPDARALLRFVMITHDNDAVGKFGTDLMVQAPAWLGPADSRAATVPKGMKWQSPVTFVQTLVDMKNAANVIPGQFNASGHDYRADLARFVAEVYALPASHEQLRAVELALRANELARKARIDASNHTDEPATTPSGAATTGATAGQTEVPPAAS